MVNDNIFQLYIPMSNVSFMQVLKRQEQLLYEPLGLLFGKLPIGHRLQMRVQALSSSVLHDEVDILWGINALMQLDDIWMIKLGQYFDFSDRLFLPLYIQQFIPIILLDGYFLSSLLVA